MKKLFILLFIFLLVGSCGQKEIIDNTQWGQIAQSQPTIVLVSVAQKNNRLVHTFSKFIKNENNISKTNAQKAIITQDRKTKPNVGYGTQAIFLINSSGSMEQSFFVYDGFISSYDQKNDTNYLIELEHINTKKTP